MTGCVTIRSRICRRVSSGGELQEDSSDLLAHGFMCRATSVLIIETRETQAQERGYVTMQAATSQGTRGAISSWER